MRRRHDAWGELVLGGAGGRRGVYEVAFFCFLPGEGSFFLSNVLVPPCPQIQLGIELGYSSDASGTCRLYL
jgi:hypothetical protein